MKKSKLIVVTTFLIISLFMSFSAVNAADYFPLSVGNRWVYSPSFGINGNRVDTIIGEEIINGIHTYIWNRQEAPDDNYNEKRWLAKDNTGVKVYKYWSNEGPDPAVITNPPYITFKSNPNVGDTFIEEFNPSSVILYTGTSYIESVSETVTVPAGSFTNCVRIRRIDEMTQNSIKTAFGWHKEWYAPNIGRVIHAKYDANWGSVTTTQQLIGFSVTRGLPGDVNSDGNLGLGDAIYILQTLVGLRPTGATSVTGSWNVTVVENGGGGTFTMSLTQSDSSVTGTVSMKGYNGNLSGSISGSTISLFIPDPDPACSGSAGSLIGTVSGNTMSGNYTSTAGGTCPTESGTWIATK